jgi:oxygen-independent coproporphyrinogen III oxidase
MAGIYIHIPFCKQACHYCDFHFTTNQNNKVPVLEALTEELRLQKMYLNEEEIKTIYLGGGTPSILSGQELDQIFSTLYKSYMVSGDAEITLEANPDDLSKRRLDDMKKIGINRLSIGIQSFDNSILKFLNRAHDADLAIQSYNDARAAGFENISIDLIYAIPGQDVGTWKKNIDQALALAPEHISAYSLTIEPKTVFGKWSAEKKMAHVNDDIAANDLLLLIASVEDAGFEHYEISNFCRPGYISRHNSNYWKSEMYLGIGPSAHSYNGDSRQFNVSNNYAYVTSILSKKIPATVEALTREDKINDSLLTTLRTSWGADLSKLRKNFQYDLLEMHQAYIKNLIENRLATIQDEMLTLTKSGRLLADKIAADLFA